MKRIAAIIGIVILLSLYLITFISAFFAKEYMSGLFMASLFSTIVIPILIYGFMLVNKSFRKKDKDGITLQELKKQNKEYSKQQKKSGKNLDK